MKFEVFLFFFAVPPNLFSGLHIPDPTSGPHINTFGRNIVYRIPSARL